MVIIINNMFIINIITITSTTLTPLLLFFLQEVSESFCAVSPELVLGSALADLAHLDHVAARLAPPPDSLDARVAPTRGGSALCETRTDAQAPQFRAPPCLQSSFGRRMGRRRATAAEQEKPRAIPQEPDPCCSPAAVCFVARRLWSRPGSLRPPPECERPRGLPGETAPVRNEGVVPSLLRSSAAAPASGPPPVLGLAPNFPLGTRALLWCPRHRAWLIHPF